SRWSAAASHTRRTRSRAPCSSRTAGCGFGCVPVVSCREPLVVVAPEVSVVDHPLLSLFLMGLTVAHTVEVVAGLVFSERVVAVDAPGPEGMVALVTHGEFAQVEVVEPGAAVNHHRTSSMNS